MKDEGGIVIHDTVEADGWLRRFNWLLALGAFIATAWYLADGLPYTLLNLALAGTVLAAPMVLTRRTRSAFVPPAVWFAVGIIPLGYVFGVFVALAGVVGLAASAACWLSRGRCLRPS